MRKYQSVNPSNSRIFINFDNKENPVSFEYPDRSPAFWVVFPSIATIYSILLLIFLVVNIPLIIILLIRNIDSALFYILFGLIAFLLSLLLIPLTLTIIITNSEALLRKMPMINFTLSRIAGFEICRVYIDKMTYSHTLKGRVS